MLDYLEAVQAMGLRLAIASSSRQVWVEDHLKQLGLLCYFSGHLYQKEDVALTKPDSILSCGLPKG